MSDLNMPLPVRTIDSMSNILGFISGSCIALAAVLILAEIFNRDFFGASLLISDEYTGYLMAASSFLGLSFVEKTHGHIRMDMVMLLEQKFPVMLYCLKVLCYTIAIIFAIYLTYVSAMLFLQSLAYNSRSMQYSETLLYIPQFVLPVGALALALQYLANMYKLIAHKSSN